MAWKGIVCKRFSPAEFDDDVGHLTFSAWRPQFVVVHNTSVPSLAQRPNGFTQQHIQNLKSLYRTSRDGVPDHTALWIRTVSGRLRR